MSAAWHLAVVGDLETRVISGYSSLLRRSNTLFLSLSQGMQLHWCQCHTLASAENAPQRSAFDQRFGFNENEHRQLPKCETDQHPTLAIEGMVWVLSIGKSITVTRVCVSKVGTAERQRQDVKSCSHRDDIRMNAIEPGDMW